jgi:hypothetical protein
MANMSEKLIPKNKNDVNHNTLRADDTAATKAIGFVGGYLVHHFLDDATKSTPTDRIVNTVYYLSNATDINQNQFDAKKQHDCYRSCAKCG